MKKTTLLLLFSVFSFKLSWAAVILIDPGHGGQELGAVGKKWKKHKQESYLHNVYEKDLTLILAKRLKRELEKHHTVYLTRSVDRHVSLEERAQMANTVKANLFVSIHFNSASEHDSHGIETYYLDNHDDAAVKKVEGLENSVFNVQDQVVNKILIDLVIHKTAKSSRKLALAIHKQLNSKVIRRYKMRDRGVKAGLFYVLALAQRPAVLIEGGFMSNKNDLSKMMRNDFLQNYAKAMAQGIKNYLSQLPPKDLALF